MDMESIKPSKRHRSVCSVHPVRCHRGTASLRTPQVSIFSLTAAGCSLQLPAAPSLLLLLLLLGSAASGAAAPLTRPSHPPVSPVSPLRRAAPSPCARGRWREQFTQTAPGERARKAGPVLSAQRGALWPRSEVNCVPASQGSVWSWLGTLRHTGTVPSARSARTPQAARTEGGKQRAPSRVTVAVGAGRLLGPRQREVRRSAGAARCRGGCHGHLLPQLEPSGNGPAGARPSGRFYGGHLSRGRFEAEEWGLAMTVHHKIRKEVA